MEKIYSFSSADIRRLRTLIYFSRMSVPDDFLKTPIEELQRIYNGVGPGHWSARFRRFTSWVLDFLEAPAMIHDWEYTFRPKTYWSFTLANLRLAKNSARDGHLFAGLTAGLLCQLFGWHSWKEGRLDD